MENSFRVVPSGFEILDTLLGACQIALVDQSRDIDDDAAERSQVSEL